jgi:hypothetical protein
MHILGSLEKSILEFEEMALQELIEQILIVLLKRYRFEQVVGALIHYCRSRGDDWQKAAEHLQAARLVLLEMASRRDREGDLNDHLG